MATNTYVALDKVTVTTPLSSVDFTSINQGYTDLRVVISARGSVADTLEIPVLRFNGDTATNYSRTILYGNGSTATSARSSNQTGIAFEYATGSNATAGVFGMITLDVMSYANTNVNKTVISRLNEISSYTNAQVSLWRSTAAITSMSIVPVLGTTWAAGSTFSLYGIAAAASSSPKATGGTIYSDATYWYHAFGATGTFTPSQSLSCDVAVIAGGGGGNRAGGGAGGLRVLSSQSVTAQAYTVTIGGGGANAYATSSIASRGADSSFSGSGFTTITASGGGGGTGGQAGQSQATANNGGSGGGAGNDDDTAYAGGLGNIGSYSPVEGYNGGASYIDQAFTNYSSGGGGGAGGVGQRGSTNGLGRGGDGGIGSTALSTWGYDYLAGGGGGNGTITPNGQGGLGGGGSAITGSSGTANTGGGGGAPLASTGGNGGSGLVVIRYAK
jgi:hypothetical protein